MHSAKSSETSKSKSEPAPEKRTGSKDTASLSQLNPIWTSIATHVGGHAATSALNEPAPIGTKLMSGSSPYLQRMCSECEEELAQNEARNIQTKLTIGAPDDEYEREADNVAAYVMRKVNNGGRLSTGTPKVQRKVSAINPVQRGCNACAAKQDLPLLQPKLVARTVQRLCTECAANLDDRLQRKKSSGAMESSSLGTVQRAIESPGAGSGVHSDVRAQVEPVLGADLSGVRVYADARAQQAAKDINAKAFTHGNNIFLGSGQSGSDLGLMAHELTHTVQQGASPTLQRQPKQEEEQRQAESIDNEEQLIARHEIHALRSQDGLVQRGVLSTLRSVGSSIWEADKSVVETAVEVGETVVGAGERAGEAIVETAGHVGETAAEGVSWLTNQAGRAALAAANALAEQFGGLVTVGRAGLVITIPNLPFCPEIKHKFDIPGKNKFIKLIKGEFSVGEITVIGTVGLNFSYKPSLTGVLGPCYLSGVRIELNPLTGRYLATGTFSVGAALTQLNVARGGLLGKVDVIVIVPVGDIPVPVKISAASIEGGGQLSLRLSGGGTLSSVVSLLYSGGSLSFSTNPTLALGGAIDLDLGAFARLDVLKTNLCDFVWPLWHWGASIAHQWSLPLSLSYGRGGAGLTIGPIDSMPIPFDDAVSGIDRTPPGTNCMVLDRICFVMRTLGLLPSQRGVVWTGHPPPPVPTPCNAHSDAPYVEDPLIPSGANCRGVCGPDCASNCTPDPDMSRCAEYPGGAGHFICEYKGVQTCGTHLGCRNHDACYDWCAAGGSPSIFDNCHRWCDLGCICDFDVNRCIGWALGLPPFDSEMTFYDETISLMHGPFPGACPEGAIVAFRVFQYLSLDAPLAIVTALAEAPLEERMYLAADPLAMELLESAIGLLLWPIAQRILEGAASTAVPSLDEATWFLADQAIHNGDQARALRIVLDTLISRGIINANLAEWSFVARADRGEGLTIFRLVEDPMTHERRAHAPVRVEIYTPAFLDVGWLFSTVQHEYVHVLQVLAGYEAAEFTAGGRQRPEFVDRDEVEAYLWEIEHSVGSGLINNVAQMRDIGHRLTEHFRAMPPILRGQYQVRYDAAQQRVRDVVAGRPNLSIDEARRIVRESSQRIAELLQERPGNEAAIDAQIEAIRQQRSLALIEVALVDNPSIQVVHPGEPGTYRVPTLDAQGRVRYLYGGIQVAWHMAPTSTSAYTLGEALGAGGRMAIAGTAIQGRVHPFPPDIDFDEHIHVVADTLEEAGRLAAGRIIANIRRISGHPVPGRMDLEFRHLITFPSGGASKTRMSLGQVLRGDAVTRLGHAIARLNGGNMNTFWRGMLADGRFTDITRVVFVTAERRDGTELIGMTGSADFNLAYLEDPGAVPATALGRFAWDMCCDAVRRAKAGKWLKAGKRAYNYFSTIGDTEHMAALEPVFLRPETRMEQYATVIDAIQHVLATRDMGVRQPRTRIMTVDEARRQVERVAFEVENHLPDSGTGSNPAAIARDMRILAGYFRARNARGQLAHDDLLASSFGREAYAIREHINAGVRGVVEPIIEGVVRPVCPDEFKCRRQR